MTIEIKKNTSPFLRWAGGKRWLTADYPHHLPQEYNQYFEPFLGSAAIFFYLSPTRAHLSDACKDLIDTYSALKNDWRKVEAALEHHHDLHCHEYYYKTRSSCPQDIVSRAARFIYLNRTCWNGLYRVNKKGMFNVPIGSKNTVKHSCDDFEEVSKKLKHAKITHNDFEETINQAQKGDFVFIDPPYTVKHNKNGFISYNENLFSWDDQVRLKNCIINAEARGAKLLITNADHPSIHDLYKKLGKIHTLERNSTIAGHRSKRGVTTEVIVKIGFK